ncbi:hypothetical protein [Geodermatophilus sp. FMUSA9-8]|uniref:hypothetical protein n=1 Tax=Geodermatophilus sp. FMUSA9-8 TaxID=3120155 RepID=UPI003008377A
MERLLRVGSLAVALFLATLGSFGASFGVMTNCTNTHSCTVTGCRPCTTAQTWLTAGWVLQGVLLVVGLVLVVAARRRRPGWARAAALAVGPLALVVFAATTALAVGSF